MKSRVLDTQAVARLTGATLAAVRKQRERGTGPAWFRAPDGRSALYYVEDVTAFMAGRRRSRRSRQRRS